MQNKLLKILLALIAVSAAGVAIFFEMTMEVPVLKASIAAKEVISAEDITSKRMLKSTLGEGIVEEAIELVGKEAIYSFPSFTPVPSASIKKPESKEEVIPSDEAIVPIEVPAQRVPSDLKEGDIINVMAYFQQGVVEDAPAFLVGINEKARVTAIRRDEGGSITGIDVSIKKEIAPKISASNAMGTIYIIQNVTDNDILLDATTGREIYEEGFSTGAAIVIEEEVSE